MFNNNLNCFRIIYCFFADGTKLTYTALAIGIFVAYLYFKIFFGSVSKFNENSEKMPLLDKDYDYVDSKFSSQKIMLWIFISVGGGVSAYYQLPYWFPHLFKAP